MVLEICVDSVQSAIAAEAGGAQRVELCSDLVEGGITPSAGLIHAVRRHLRIQVFVMIRPRGGDFFYADHEFETMQYDLLRAKELGAHGVVLGMLDRNGRVDVERSRFLVELARPMQVTFHRAFDMSANLNDSLERVIDSGADRILTSGGMQNISQGAEPLASLCADARGRIGIIIACGIRPGNIRKIAQRTGATEFHCYPRSKTESPMAFRKPAVKLGTSAGDEFTRFVVIEENVRRLRRALDKLDGEAP